LSTLLAAGATSLATSVRERQVPRRTAQSCGRAQGQGDGRRPAAASPEHLKARSTPCLLHSSGVRTRGRAQRAKNRGCEFVLSHGSLVCRFSFGKTLSCSHASFFAPRISRGARKLVHVVCKRTAARNSHSRVLKACRIARTRDGLEAQVAFPSRRRSARRLLRRWLPYSFTGASVGASAVGATNSLEPFALYAAALRPNPAFLRLDTHSRFRGLIPIRSSAPRLTHANTTYRPLRSSSRGSRSASTRASRSAPSAPSSSRWLTRPSSSASR
jgi:hypothetical protein